MLDMDLLGQNKIFSQSSFSGVPYTEKMAFLLNRLSIKKKASSSATFEATETPP
jgi:hypothetical protein